MGIKFSNNAEGTLSGTLTAVATTLTLNSGEGAYFPIVAGGSSDFFYATLTDASGNREIIKVTQHTAGDVFQVIERAADSVQEEAVPTAYAFAGNDTCQIRLNKAALEGFNTGATSDTFQIDVENDGPQLKNNSGDLEIRDADDLLYANLTALGMTLNGALVVAGTVTGITDLTASGTLTAAALALTGAITGATTINASGAITAASLVLSGAITGATDITASGTITAEQLTSTDDINATDDITAGGQIGGATISISNGGSIAGSLTLASVSCTGALAARDHGTASVDEVVNVCYGTGSPPAASTTTIGALFIKYTA